MSLRVLICDDEPQAVARLVALLARLPDVVVVATALDGSAALLAARSTQPDLILLDIELPGVTGLEIAGEMERLPEAERPFITFVTGLASFAPDAFDRGAVDFLSKPVRFARLETSVKRARRLVAGRNAERMRPQLEKMVDSLRQSCSEACNPHVWVQRRGELIRVDLAEIERASAEGPYVRLHLQGRTYLHREPISSIEARLAPGRYVRAHRSHLVRVAQVASIRRTTHGGAELILQSGDRVPVGRSHAKDVRRIILNQGRRF